MKVCNVQRGIFYSVLDRCYKQLNISPSVIELGVLKGVNAESLKKTLSPKLLLLIDAWSSEAMDRYSISNAHRSWVKSAESLTAYFGGPVSSQETFDKLFQEVYQKFLDDNTVQIIRKTTRDALLEIRANSDGKGFDLIYIDANHQYETVLDDLIDYQAFLSETGVLQLNDCCHSNAGINQNLGVLEAVNRFVKQMDFVPVALTNTDFSDILLTHRESPMLRLIDSVIKRSNITYVEVPHQLLGAARIIEGSGKISFV